MPFLSSLISHFLWRMNKSCNMLCFLVPLYFCFFHFNLCLPLLDDDFSTFIVEAFIFTSTGQIINSFADCLYCT